MTEQDRAAVPAKSSEYRAINRKTKDVIYLQTPDLIKYHAPNGYILQQRNPDDAKQWVTVEPPPENPQEENVEDASGGGA